MDRNYVLSLLTDIVLRGVEQGAHPVPLESEHKFWQKYHATQEVVRLALQGQPLPGRLDSDLLADLHGKVRSLAEHLAQGS
jgi:hypothetical protein